MKPAFADKIPPMEPTLPELAEIVFEADAAAWTAYESGEWESNDAGVLVAQDALDAFWAAHEAATGLTREQIRELV